MPRIALGLEYDGRAFAGWQSQIHAQTVQSVVQAALALVADHPINVIAAGRTDAGVHAISQVIHFDTEALRSERSWVMGANANLPESVSILWSRPIADDFHARYSALARSYRYVILNRLPRPALLNARVGWVREKLDFQRMHRAAQHLVGEHDFSSYRAAQCQSRTAMRHLHRISVARHGEYVVLDVTANAFLHHMVRNIVGVLIPVGRGLQDEQWPLDVLQLRDRTQAGITASAAGLYLFGVHYPKTFGLPSFHGAQVWPPGPEMPEPANLTDRIELD